MSFAMAIILFRNVPDLKHFEPVNRLFHAIHNDHHISHKPYKNIIALVVLAVAPTNTLVYMNET